MLSFSVASSYGKYRSSTDANADKALLISLTCLLLICAAHAVYYFLKGATNPISDLYSFRQTQTALSAYWLWAGGPWLAYETPVLGYPWSIPFEFPTYVALIAVLLEFGVPLELSGRLLSFGFYLGCIWVLWRTFRSVGLPTTAFLTTSILLLASPIYIFWSRTVMIETCALFFSALWLWLTIQLTRMPSVFSFVATVTAGSIAIASKATTFPAFAMIGGIWIIFQITQGWRGRISSNSAKAIFVASLACVLPFILGLAWVAFTDSVKERNPFGSMLTSSALNEWNLGTWPQRLSAKFWYDVVLQRTTTDILGYSHALAILIFAGLFLLSRGRFIAWLARKQYSVKILRCALAFRRHLPVISVCILAFLVPMIAFTNVHAIHSYYQTANAIFLLCAVGLAVSTILQSLSPLSAILCIVIIVGGQLSYFHKKYSPIIGADYSKDTDLLMGLMVREQTQPTDAIIVLGRDWSSAIGYYSQRKSLTLPRWTPTPLMQKVFKDPQTFISDLQLAGIVVCPKPEITAKTYGDRAHLVSAFIANRAVKGSVGGCQFLSPVQTNATFENSSHN